MLEPDLAQASWCPRLWDIFPLVLSIQSQKEKTQKEDLGGWHVGSSRKHLINSLSHCFSQTKALE